MEFLSSRRERALGSGAGESRDSEATQEAGQPRLLLLTGFPACLAAARRKPQPGLCPIPASPGLFLLPGYPSLACHLPTVSVQCSLWAAPAPPSPPPSLVTTLITLGRLFGGHVPIAHTAP